MNTWRWIDPAKSALVLDVNDRGVRNVAFRDFARYVAKRIADTLGIGRASVVHAHDGQYPKSRRSKRGGKRLL